MLFAFLQIMIAWYYGHFAEWALHRYLLHGVGKKRSSMWSFHFHEHHSLVRRNEHIDSGYAKCVFKWDPQSKELVGLLALAAAHLPLLPFVPFFVITIWVSILQYYYMHKRSHIDVRWAKENVPWHYDHHMGKNQNLNWGVRSDMIDRLFRTRRSYSKSLE